MTTFKLFIFLLLALATTSGFSQKRFKNEVFIAIDSTSNVEYGKAVNIKGENETLLLDVFSPPKEDTMKKRPLLIFIHGGGFQNNSKTGSYSSMVCASFAKRGYVTASIDYRLGVEKSGMGNDGKKEKTNTDYAEALYRAQQDGKAAIRFFRKNAKKYGIDTSQIFLTGSSAGSKTCMAIAYMDEKEVPKEINQKKWGSLEGNSGNEGFSSKVAGVMNAWGAMIDYRWIQKGDVPLFNTAGTEDKTVPFDSAYNYHGFKYGAYILFQHCLSIGVPTGWRPFYATGHTLDNNKTKQDSCIQSMAAWLYTQLKINKGKNDEGVFRFEKEMNTFDSLNAVEKYNNNAILFIGSSYIRKWANIKSDLNYTNIIHRGFGGSNLRDVAYYIKRIAYSHQPKAIFIYVGNDITASEKDKEPDQVVELYKYVIKVLREKFPTTPITWLAISPSIKRWSVWDKISQLNSLVKNYAASEPNLFYVDAGKNFLGKDGKPDPKYFLEDQLHYNEEGYKLWGRCIKDAVKKITEGEL